LCAEKQPSTTIGRRASGEPETPRDACRLPAVGHANSQVARLCNSDAHGAALRPTLISAELEKPWVVYDAAELFTNQGHTGMIR